jgi:hypothetical protein
MQIFLVRHARERDRTLSLFFSFFLDEINELES